MSNNERAIDSVGKLPACAPEDECEEAVNALKILLVDRQALRDNKIESRIVFREVLDAFDQRYVCEHCSGAIHTRSQGGAWCFNCGTVKGKENSAAHPIFNRIRTFLEATK